jgi:hypothetical protein
LPMRFSWMLALAMAVIICWYLSKRGL